MNEDIPVEQESPSGVASYKSHNKRKILFLIVLLCSLVVLSFITLNIDLRYISYGEMFRVIFDRNNPNNNIISDILIWDLYIPRILSGILAGFALGIAGAVMQCVLRNPLASPYTLGVSNAAAFGASMGIVLLGGGAILGQSIVTIDISNPYIVTISAFFWAMVATMIIVVLVKVTKVSSEAMVLAGVAVSSIFAAGISLLQYIYNDMALSAIVFWQFGSLGKANWDQLTLIFVVLIACVIYFFYKRWDFNALDTGDDTARSLGVDTNSLRITTLILSAVLTAVVVSFMGVIGFVGLLGPHIVRRILGNDNRYVLIGSMIVGALVLVIADCFGQNIADFTIPVGIITSFLGGPIFIYILIRSYRRTST